MISGPNFFIIGAAKAATTSLSSLLFQHPEVAIVQGKEPHFFSFDPNFQKGWQSYLQLFHHCKDEIAIGDASTSYSRVRYHPQVVKRMHHHCPDAKIIYMVRQPIERMESAVMEHIKLAGRLIFKNINEAVRKQPMILDSSRYWEVYQAYRQFYDEKCLHIIWFEDFINHPIEVFEDCCRFLQVDSDFTPDMNLNEQNERTKNISRVQGLDPRQLESIFAWEPQLKSQVLEELKADNLQFLAHFEKPCDYWGDIFTS